MGLVSSRNRPFLVLIFGCSHYSVVLDLRKRHQGNHARQLTTNADASRRTQMKPESVRDFHSAQDAAKMSCQCNDKDSDK
jgi:hypothetical protein